MRRTPTPMPPNHTHDILHTTMAPDGGEGKENAFRSTEGDALTDQITIDQ